MKRFKNILYVFNGEQNNTVGLQRACKTTALNQASLSLVVTNVSADFVKNHENEIRNQIASLLTDNINVEDISIFFSFEIPKIDIIRRVIANHHDLVITEPDAASGLKKFFYGTTTLALLRKCPCIVWVVKPQDTSPYKKIMAAVDPIIENECSSALTDNIIELAVSMAERNHAECHIVNVWDLDDEPALENPFLGLASKAEIKRDALEEKKRHVDAFDEMMKRQTINTSECITHILHGDPKNKLAEFSVSQQFDLIVMGTLEKVGIEGFIIGSTAESLINQAECSILAIKPKDFVCPIK